MASPPIDKTNPEWATTEKWWLKRPSSPSRKTNMTKVNEARMALMKTIVTEAPSVAVMRNTGPTSGIG